MNRVGGALAVALFVYPLLGADVRLENDGTPMRVPFECTAEDSQSAGLTCSETEPCPIYLELASVEATGQRLFVAGNIHAATATLYSVLLTSTDDGHTWTEPFRRMPATVLEQIEFIDFQTGWVSGADVQSFSRDPFFLTTSDGGQTWAKQVIFGDADEHAGAIERFWFDSRTSGTLVLKAGGKHLRYETKTGGTEWTLQQASATPLSVRGADVHDNGWRIAADDKAHAYHLQRHEGARWSTQASFAIEVGACRQ